MHEETTLSWHEPLPDLSAALGAPWVLRAAFTALLSRWPLPGSGGLNLRLHLDVRINPRSEALTQRPAARSQHLTGTTDLTHPVPGHVLLDRRDPARRWPDEAFGTFTLSQAQYSVLSADLDHCWKTIQLHPGPLGGAPDPQREQPQQAFANLMAARDALVGRAPYAAQVAQAFALQLIADGLIHPGTPPEPLLSALNWAAVRAANAWVQAPGDTWDATGHVTLGRPAL